MSWRLSWLDTVEIGAHTRTWTGQAHGTWSDLLHGASAHDGELARALEDTRGTTTLLRIDATGKADAREITRELTPRTLMFGTDKQSTIVGLTRSVIFAWPRAEEPRCIAYVGGTEPLVASSATDGAVFLQTRWGDVELSHELSLSVGAPEMLAPIVPWTKSVPPFSSGALPKPCPKGSTGPIVPWSGHLQLEVEIDGGTFGVSDASYELRVSPSGDCAESLLLVLNGSRSPQHFLRANFARREIETGTVGVTDFKSGALGFIHKESVSSLTCEGF